MDEARKVPNIRNHGIGLNGSVTNGIVAVFIKTRTCREGGAGARDMCVCVRWDFVYGMKG